MNIEPGNIAAVPLFKAPIEYVRAVVFDLMLERMKVERGKMQQSTCIRRVPEHLHSELCARLLDHRIELRETRLWVNRHITGKIGRSSLHRFAVSLRKQYLALLAEKMLPEIPPLKGEK